MIGQIFYKFFYYLRLYLCSWCNYLNLSLIWSIGKGLKTEGKIFVPAVKGIVKIGNNVWLGHGVKIGATKGAKIIIGNNVSINQGSFVVALKRISIGDNCRIGEYVSIRDNDHSWRDPTKLIREQGYDIKEVSIGNDVWIGRGAAIMKGIKIGDGAVVAANAVVTKNVEPFMVVAGVPAREISKRKA